MKNNDDQTIDVEEIKKSLYDQIEDKLNGSLTSSMLFFTFDAICNFIAEEEGETPKGIQKKFFENWRKFANEYIIKEDLKIINEHLNSDINLFQAALINGKYSESTEEYQKDYYKILNRIEKNFYSTLDQKNEEIDDDDE